MALVGSILILIAGAVAIGIGLAVMGFGSTRYYRILGIAVIALGVASVLISPLGIIGSVVLAGGVAWKGLSVLGVLSGVGKEDPDWQGTRNRAMTGIVLSVIGLLIDVIWLGLVVIGTMLGGAERG